jgi:hypothetical protein
VHILEDWGTKDTISRGPHHYGGTLSEPILVHMAKKVKDHPYLLDWTGAPKGLGGTSLCGKAKYDRAADPDKTELKPAYRWCKSCAKKYKGSLQTTLDMV